MTIPINLRLGNELEGDAAVVQNQLDDAYKDLAPAINRKPNMIIMDRDPAATDNDSNLGDFWVNSSTGNKWILTDDAPTWTAF